MSKKMNIDSMIEESTFAAGAPLKHKEKAAQTEALKTINVYGIPASWVEAIKKKGYSFASFARIAVEEKMIKEGLSKKI